ncbi:unnamed protein product [Psylliodes chrysocephalus]|uniref:Exuperantia RNAse H-like domain-containing protein n=1 Tax=Psylliodes chrysocephalus TaxID=3402493 RepID=A0A9P0CHU2_9CUCU|nr:unnamed protein product [Psylliodes chrysocephala]
MLLESLRRYQMLERFSKVVKGFANGFNKAQMKCANTIKSFNLHLMSKMLLNRGAEHFNSAVDRAPASFDIAAHLAQEERTDLAGEEVAKEYADNEFNLIDVVCPYVNPARRTNFMTRNNC